MAKLRVFVVLLPLVGCTAAIAVPPLTAAHPASPEADEAPRARALETLALPSDRSDDAGAAPASSTDRSHDGHGADHAH